MQGLASRLSISSVKSRIKARHEGEERWKDLKSRLPTSDISPRRLSNPQLRGSLIQHAELPHSLVSELGSISCSKSRISSEYLEVVHQLESVSRFCDDDQRRPTSLLVDTPSFDVLSWLECVHGSRGYLILLCALTRSQLLTALARRRP